MDERLIDKPNADQTCFLLEPTERRRRMGGGAHAGPVMDRIVHNAVRIQMGEVNMRELMSKRPQAPSCVHPHEKGWALQ